ncbi:MAG: ATP-binding protein [Planctomycetota bacterium]
MARKARSSGKARGRSVRLRPHDPFDLIRLLARSQSDPRKAVAELVQNSLDAGARRIEIRWFNEKGRRTLSVWDDGAGVFPEMERGEALHRIARTIGHSHKRDLTPAQRREELILGKYGIGLIGFWSVGETLELRSRVGGGKAEVLRLREDRPQGEVFTSRSRRLDEPETFTEVTIRGVHEAALSKVRPPRLQAYLATELRGQLLERDAVVRIRDRVARGRAKKEFIVQPQPFVGRPIEGLDAMEVPGYESARVELYLVAQDEDRRGRVSLACGGTVVLDDLAEIDGTDAPRAPWASGRFEGVIDFPDLHVAPASRRGFTHDEPVAAFLTQLVHLETTLAQTIADEDERREALRSEQVARKIRQAFVSVAEALPEYDLFEVRARAASVPEDNSAASGGSGPEGAGCRPDAAQRAPAGTAVSDPGVESAAAPHAEATDEPQTLFPPGPLDRVTIRPTRARLDPSASRTFRARALDADGQACAEGVSFSWRLEGPGNLAADGATARYTSPDLVTAESEATVEVTASEHREDGSTGSAAATAALTLEPPDVRERVQGIPEPRPVSAPGESWRSRVVAGRWEYNDAHRDFLAVADVEAQRLRYLIHLFAKEVVLRNFGGPGDAEVLERMVEVLTKIGARR